MRSKAIDATTTRAPASRAARTAATASSIALIVSTMIPSTSPSTQRLCLREKRAPDVVNRDLAERREQPAERTDVPQDAARAGGAPGDGRGRPVHVLTFPARS